MIGLVLVTHGRLAAEFLAAMEHVVGPQVMVRAVCIGADDDIELRRAEIVDAIRAVDDGHGVVILTDMFGGTPSNLAISTMDRKGIEVIAGVNLPMLIKLASVRQTEPLREAVIAAQEAGRKYINVAEPAAQRRPSLISRTAVIVNQRGLHARAAAKFVRVAEDFDCQIQVVRDDQVVAGTSILGLMLLGAGVGTELVLRAEGADAGDAVAALADLIERGFDE